MASIIRTTEPIVKHPSDVQSYAMDFTLPLGTYTTRLLSSVSSISADTGITVSAEQVVTSDYTDDDTGETVAAYKAVSWSMSSGTACGDYGVTIVANVDDGSTLAGYVLVQVRSS